MEIIVNKERGDEDYAKELAKLIRENESVTLNFYGVKYLTSDFFTSLFTGAFAKDTFVRDVEKVSLKNANRFVTDAYVSSLKHYAFMMTESATLREVFR